MSYMQEYEKWLASPALSEQEHAELESIRDDEKEIRERFYGPLEFGTAGLRGTMKVGLHQMNIHVIRWATQGFANVICAEGEEAKRRAWPCAWTAATTLWSLPEPPQRSAPPTASMCVSSSRCGPRRS
ncbi:MAG: hypothetical protein ACLR39_04035 [Oscillospiraceae bacterium]